jgi:Wzt C-terminal domain
MTGNPQEAIKAYSEYAKQISSNVDLAPLPRAFESTQEARLLRVQSLENGSNAAWCFEYGQPLEFLLEFSVATTLQDPEIAYQLFSLTGVQLASSNTNTFQAHRISRLSPGRYALKITLPDFFLNPGTYTLGFSICVAERNVDNVPGAAQIEILPSATSIEKHLNRVWAPLTPSAEFKINPL